MNSVENIIDDKSQQDIGPISDGLKKMYSMKRKRKRDEDKNHEDTASADMSDLESSAAKRTVNVDITEQSEQNSHKRKEKHKSHKRIRRSVEDTQPREHMEVLDAVTGHVKVSLNDTEEDESVDEENVEHTESTTRSSRTKVKAKCSEPVKNSSKVTKEIALEYLHLWNNREVNGEWSFKKKTQYWLLQSMYHKSKVPNPEFEILLKYLEDLKGHQKELAIDKAHKTIEQEGEVSKRRYKRALAILRVLA